MDTIRVSISIENSNYGEVDTKLKIYNPHKCSSPPPHQTYVLSVCVKETSPFLSRTKNVCSYTMNKISNWSLFKLFFSDQALIKLKLFFVYICAV